MEANHSTNAGGGGTINILYGFDETINAIMEFIDKTRRRYDVYADSNTPSFIMNNEGIRRKFIDFKNQKGGYIRCITEITRDNIDYCKQIMKNAELRHISGPKGIFRVNETEYQYNAVLEESRQIAVLIRSNLKDVVSQQQIVFDALWDKATLGEQRIREIEGEQLGKDRIMAEKHVTTTDKDKPPNVILDVIIEQEKMKEKKQKETNTILSNQIPDYDKDHQLRSKKIQLWSDSSRREYAIRLEGESGFLVTTSEDITTQYIDLVEEVDHLEDLKYDWTYTLKHWISNRYHHDNNREMDDTEKTSSSSPYSPTTTTASTVSSVYDEKINTDNKSETEKLKNDDKFRYDSNNMNKHIGYNRILRFRCHFCKLMFDSSIKRNGHEQAWHSSNNATTPKT